MTAFKYGISAMMALLSIALPGALAAQSPPQTASLSGVVVSELGQPLRALVAVRPAAAGPVLHGATRLDGSFSFQQLAPGQYTFCARIPAEQASRPDQPFLDTCVWEQPQVPIQVLAGQALTGVRIVAPQGSLLQVRVDDPDKVLTPVAATAGVDFQIDLTILAANRMVHRPDLISQDANGRNYTITVPAGTPLSFSAKSSVGKLFDQSAQAVIAEAGVMAPKGSSPAPIKLTIHRN